MSELLNRVTQGDCLEVMREIPDKSVDMILCDLPYGTTACKWDAVIPFEPLWEQYERIVKDNGAIVLTASQPFTSYLITSNIRYFKYSWVWEKSRATGHLNSKIQPMRNNEDICVFYKKQPTYNPLMREGKPYKVSGGAPIKKGEDKYVRDFNRSTIDNKGERYPVTVLKVPNESKTVHPTQKPVALFEYLIQTYTNEGETVLDNCLGSGTTAVAAMNSGRNFIGIEREPEYVAIANERIEKALSDKEGA